MRKTEWLVVRVEKLIKSAVKNEAAAQRISESKAVRELILEGLVMRGALSVQEASDVRA